MSKMLVCDFDDTVKISSKFITHINFEAIKRFRKKGNKLVFATGRNFTSIKRELINYSCRYDALICNDGSIGFDSQDKVIYNRKFDEFELEDIMYYLEHYAKNYIHGYDLYNFCGYTKIPKDIIDILVYPKLFKKTSTMIAELNSIFPDLNISKFNYKIFIRKNCTKSDGIKEVSKFLDIKKDDIYTIGDWDNDLEMIRDYNGYNVLFSHPKLYKESKGTVLNVAHLVKKLENK